MSNAKTTSKTAKTSSNLSTLGAFVAAIPVFGWMLSPILILVAFILAVVSMSKEEKGGGRALVNSILSAPLAILMGFIGIAIFGNL